MSFFIDDEDPKEKAAREEERRRMRLLGKQDSHQSQNNHWDTATTSRSLYKIFESVGIVHATPKQLRNQEKRNIK